MKKVILAAASVFFAFASQAVTVDWSVDQILSPTTSVSSSASTGTSVTFSAVLKNLGTDSVITGDTVIYQLAFLNGSTPLIVGPNSGFYFTIVKKTIKSGDTMMLNGTWKIGNYPTASINVKFGIICHVINASRGLKIESATIANNQKTVDVTWFNPQGWAVSVGNIKAGVANIYPTIAQDVLHVQMNLVDPNHAVTVVVTDLSGKTVITRSFVAGSDIELSTASLANGSYVVRIENGNLSSATKFFVQK